MTARVSAEMKRARRLLAQAVERGEPVSFSLVAKKVGLTVSAVQKDAECQRLMPGGGTHLLKPEMHAAIALWEAGGISKREAARQCGVSDSGLVLALQRKNKKGDEVAKNS